MSKMELLKLRHGEAKALSKVTDNRQCTGYKLKHTQRYMSILSKKKSWGKKVETGVKSSAL